MSQYHNFKALQVELWENCSNNCKFCYLKEGRIFSTPEQQLKAISTTNIILDTLSDEYEAFGLIGGEFFQGQLANMYVKNAFKQLIVKLDYYISSGRLKQVWITASLMSDLEDFFYCLGNVENKKDFLICTSYDTEGRFKDKEQKELWFKNLKTVYDAGFILHTQSICTSYFIDEALTTSILEDISRYSMFDFKCPGPFRESFIRYTGKRDLVWYRDLFKKNISSMDKGFFIEDRSKFLKFLIKIKEVFGQSKLEAFCSNEVRSDSVYLLPINKWVNDRWDSDDENASCGHPWDSFCYVNSDKCARCDAAGLLDE